LFCAIALFVFGPPLLLVIGMGHALRALLLARALGRGLFHAGDLQALFEHTVGSCAGSFGGHSYPQRSQRSMMTTFRSTAIGRRAS
jgi:hypothetical protein